MIQPDETLDALRRHLITDGFDLVLDMRESRGATLVDARDGTRYLDLFSFFASNALGMNHPALVEEEFCDRLGSVAANKPSNSDIYTTYLAEYVETFERVLGDAALPHYFLIEGGALAVENALKVAFDWKSRRNEAAGRSPDLGMQVMHLTCAFHGRSGYTLSLTNTEPVKTDRYPKLDWPRLDVPAMRFPLEDHPGEVERAEERALEQARRAFEQRSHDVACFIAEPIQSEGGDNHLRAEFLQAMQRMCHDHEALFVLDEVQTGVGMTGTAWAYEQLGIAPDIVAYAKKLHVGGIMAGRRVDEVEEHALATSGRLNSTFGGNLVDIVRATRIMEVLDEDDLFARSATLGEHLLKRLVGLATDHDGLVTNPRGRGLMCAFDLPDGHTRDVVRERLFADERVMILGCGERSIRFRPPLTIDIDDLDAGIDALHRVLAGVGRASVESASVGRASVGRASVGRDGAR